MENLAAADAAIGCWNDKYYWQLLAADHGDPKRRRRRQPGDGRRPDVAAPDRPSDTGLQRRRRSSRRPSPTTPRGTAAATSAIVHTLQNFFGTDKIAFSAFSNKSGHHADLRPLLRRAQGGHRRPRLGGHPLPHRRPAGSRARQEGRPLRSTKHYFQPVRGKKDRRTGPG